jgi:predicted nuclease with TOPRIM domain
MSRLFYGKETLTKVIKESEEIFSVFTETQKKLENVNSKIVALSNSKKEEVKKLLDEVTQLETIATKNSSISKRIDSFINGSN